MKIEKGSIKYLIIQIVAFCIAAMIIWPIFDLLLDTYFTHSTFKYTVQSYVVSPIIFGVICGTVMWLVDRGKKTK